LISRSVRKAGIAGLYGQVGTVNTTGDDQKKLDVLSNEMMVNSLYNSHVCCILVSEENEEPIIIPENMAGMYDTLLLYMITCDAYGVFTFHLYLFYRKILHCI
jgi:fructose-1,6-bisphosphatase